MKYIIMCGGKYGEYPKHLIKVMGEPILMRTIRLLVAYGVEDIFVSTNDPRIRRICECLPYSVNGHGIMVVSHDNDYVYGHEERKCWLKGFVRVTEPVTYIFGDVYFSENYMKTWAEPFAFKVMDPELFFQKVEECHKYDLEGRFHREAVSWELWQVIKGTELDVIDYTNYHAVNDYTCDIDNEDEARELERKVWGV